MELYIIAEIHGVCATASFLYGNVTVNVKDILGDYMYVHVEVLKYLYIITCPHHVIIDDLSLIEIYSGVQKWTVTVTIYFNVCTHGIFAMYMKLTIINYTVLDCGWTIGTVLFTSMYTWKISYVLSVKVTLSLWGKVKCYKFNTMK